MKTNKHKNIKGYISFLVLIFLLSSILSSCSRKISFMASQVVPAAKGSVKIKKDKNENRIMELSIVRLADPQRLSPPKEMYIVWMETDEHGTKNIGQLKTSDELFSKSLKSYLKTITTLKPAKFFITAEDNADVQYPTGQVILRTGVV